MGPAGLRDRVEARAAIVLRESPLRRDPAVVLEPPQGRVERALLDAKDVVGGAFHPPRDAVAVSRPAEQRLQDQNGERPLQQITGVGAHGFPWQDYGTG